MLKKTELDSQRPLNTPQLEEPTMVLLRPALVISLVQAGEEKGNRKAAAGRDGCLFGTRFTHLTASLPCHTPIPVPIHLLPVPANALPALVGIGSSSNHPGVLLPCAAVFLKWPPMELIGLGPQ